MDLLQVLFAVLNVPNLLQDILDHLNTVILVNQTGTAQLDLGTFLLLAGLGRGGLAGRGQGLSFGVCFLLGFVLCFLAGWVVPVAGVRPLMVVESELGLVHYVSHVADEVQLVQDLLIPGPEDDGLPLPLAAKLFGVEEHGGR